MLNIIVKGKINRGGDPMKTHRINIYVDIIFLTLIILVYAVNIS